MPALGYYVPMGAIQPDTVLTTSAGGTAVVVFSMIRQGDFEVSNFEVEGVHNYYAAAPGFEGPGILVHNDCIDLVRRVNNLPANARLTTDQASVFRSPRLNDGIDPRLASERLHAIKSAAGRGGADNVVFDMTGNIFSPEMGELLGSLTQGGARRIR